MAKAPPQQPIINIPGLDEASEVKLYVKHQGENLVFQMMIDEKPFKIDPDNEWAGRDWYGLVIRELDRRSWTYKVDVGATINTYIWRKP